MVQLTTETKVEDGSTGADVKSEPGARTAVKSEPGATDETVKSEGVEKEDELAKIMGALSIDAKAKLRHPLDESDYALEVVDGIVPEAPLQPPSVSSYHDGCWFVISVGFRVGIFPYWHEVKQLVDRCPGNTYKKYRSYAGARSAFETARKRNVVVEVRRKV